MAPVCPSRAAAPVDTDDPEVVCNEGADEVEPQGAREIHVDEHHRVAGRPRRVVQPDLADIYEHESVPLPSDCSGCDT
jgi:hypothetical protein